MRIKTFEIRVDPAFREHDERTVNEFLSAVRVPRLHCGCLRSRSAWMLLVIFNEETADEPAMRAALAGRHLPAGAELTPGECERFEALRVWRDRRAAEMGCKPFVIASNRDLLNVARFNDSNTQRGIPLYQLVGGKNTAGACADYNDIILHIRSSR